MTSYSDQNLRKERERVPLGAHYIAQVDRFHSHFTLELCLLDVSFFSCVGIDCSGRWPTVLCVPPSATTFAGR